MKHLLKKTVTVGVDRRAHVKLQQTLLAYDITFSDLVRYITILGAEEDKRIMQIIEQYKQKKIAGLLKDYSQNKHAQLIDAIDENVLYDLIENGEHETC